MFNEAFCTAGRTRTGTGVIFPLDFKSNDVNIQLKSTLFNYCAKVLKINEN